MSKIAKQHRVDQTMKNMIATILAQQEEHIAYKTGYNRPRRLVVGTTYHGAKFEGVKAGFPLHTYENQLFVLGFDDRMQDDQMDIVMDADGTIVELSRATEDAP